MPNDALIRKADAVARKVAKEFTEGTHEAIVVKSGAGAGKSGLVVQAAGTAAKAGCTLAVAAPTNAQVQALVTRLATRYPALELGYLHAGSVTVPPDIAFLQKVSCSTDATHLWDVDVVLATADKFAYSVDKLPGFDRLVLDEAYQADSARYFCIAGLAEHHLLVGDSGQLDPFSTVDCSRWRGLPEDPLLTAVGVLLRNHEPSVHTLPVTRRLPPSAIPVVQPAFYGDALTFEATTLPGDRELRLGRRSRQAGLADSVWDHASKTGWAHLELPAVPVLVNDPEAAQAIVDLLRRLLERGVQARCEKDSAWRALTEADVAVAVSHNDQKNVVRMLMDDAGLADVRVDTANRLQGLEFEVVVAWHPLAGLPDLDEFHLDPGRLCVMLTRHRHACVVVGRATDRDLVRFQPPTTPAYLGHDPDPVLDGWEAHRQVFESLEDHVIAA